MKNNLLKIVIALNIVLVAFFTKNIVALADGYKDSIKCTYVLPLNYNIGITGSKESNELIVEYSGNDDSYTLTYASTYNSLAENKGFDDKKFFKYIKGEGNGSKKNRGEDYRTCPLYIYYEKGGFGDDTIKPIKWETFKDFLENSEDYSYYDKYYVEVEKNNFVSKKKSKQYLADIRAIHSSNEPYPMFLKKQVIDGRDVSSKPKIAIEKYFNLLYGFNNDGNSNIDSMNEVSVQNDTIKMTVFNETLSIKKDYLNITNYSFSDYESFKKYALSDSIGSESDDSNMTLEQWQTRQVFLYRIENYKKLREFLQNDDTYKTIYNEKYQDSSYKTMNYLINLVTKKNTEEKTNEADSRKKSADKYKENICNSVCSDSTGKIYETNAFNACVQSEPYKKCNNCKKNSCANVPASELDNCMKGCFGGSEYQNILTKVQNNSSELEKLTENLYRVKAPEIDIDFNKRAELKCEDVVVFHTIYVILEIIAPILVIVFGSLDYAKAVMASDIEKMEKSKKLFPKRLLFVVLFVLVPLIINILLSYTNIDTNLMKCVILGN